MGQCGCLGSGRGDALHAVPLGSLSGELLREGGGADGGGAVRPLQVGASSHLCFDDAAVLTALHHPAGAAQFAVPRCCLSGLLRAEGRV